MTGCCTVPGCDKPPRRASAELCPKHYHRWYRHGSVDADFTHHATSKGRRYRLISAPGHPVCPPCGRAYEHRVVLYDAIGDGPHPCHWCQREVIWNDDRFLPLVVDHLDDDGANNNLANLVATCSDCNNARGSAERHRRLIPLGVFKEHDTVARTGSGRRTDRLFAAA